MSTQGTVTKSELLSWLSTSVNIVHSAAFLTEVTTCCVMRFCPRHTTRIEHLRFQREQQKLITPKEVAKHLGVIHATHVGQGSTVACGMERSCAVPRVVRASRGRNRCSRFFQARGAGNVATADPALEPTREIYQKTTEPTRLPHALGQNSFRLTVARSLRALQTPRRADAAETRQAGRVIMH